MTAVFVNLQPPVLSLSGHREMEIYGRQSSPAASADLTASNVLAPVMRQGSAVVLQRQHLVEDRHTGLQMPPLGAHPLILQDQCILKTPGNLKFAGNGTRRIVDSQNVNIYMRAYSAVVIRTWTATTNIFIAQELMLHIRDPQRLLLSWVLLTVPTDKAQRTT